MTETPVTYRLNPQAEQSILTTEADTMRAEPLPADARAQLVELERRLIPLLIAVQRALGKEPSVMTRAQRAPRQRNHLE